MLFPFQAYLLDRMCIDLLFKLAGGHVGRKVVGGGDPVSDTESN